MINFAEGKINLDEKNILSFSEYECLNALAERGLIKRRKDPGDMYYYVEIVEDGIRFGIFISLKEKKIEYIILRWLDGPCTSKGWDGVSEKALKDEYRLLLKFVEKKVGSPPDNKRDRRRIWRFAWGQVDVTYEPRDFAVHIFMKPR